MTSRRATTALHCYQTLGVTRQYAAWGVLPIGEEVQRAFCCEDTSARRPRNPEPTIYRLNKSVISLRSSCIWIST